MSHTPETKEKIRASLTGRTVPDQVRAKISAAQRGKPKHRGVYKPKKCNHCGEEFEPRSGNVKWCYTCIPRGASGAVSRWQWYQLTQPAYDALLSTQNGGCAICKCTDKKLVVDHNHQTGAVRGLLCFRCNVALSYIEDKSLLTSSQQYLNEHQSLTGTVVALGL